MIDHAAIAAAALAHLAAEILASGLAPCAPELAESRREAVHALETLADHGTEDMTGHAAGMAYTLREHADTCEALLLLAWEREILTA